MGLSVRHAPSVTVVRERSAPHKLYTVVLRVELSSRGVAFKKGKKEHDGDASAAPPHERLQAQLVLHMRWRLHRLVRLTPTYGGENGVPHSSTRKI